MFCGKCGEKIEDGLVFCPECGAEIKNNKPKERKGPEFSKKRIGLIVVSIAVIIAILVGINVFKGYAKELMPEEVSIANNNAQNMGFVASDGKWLYYKDPMNMQVCKVKKSDLSGKQYASFGDVDMDSGIAGAGKDVYYFNSSGNLCKGSGDKIVDLSLPTSYAYDVDTCFPFDGKIFYERVDDGIYAVKAKSTTDKEKISTVYGSSILLHGDYLYIKNYTDGVYRVKKDGTEQKKILADTPDILVVSGDRIFYSAYDGIYNDVLYSAKLDGSDIKELASTEGYYNWINVSGGYVFYVDDEYNLYRVDRDGKNDKKLIKNCIGLNIIDDMLYFYTFEGDYDDYSNDRFLSLARMNFDGEKKEVVH